MKTKKCNVCGITKSLDNFEKRSDSKDGYRQQCKDCKKVRSTHSKAEWAKEDNISFWRVRAYSINSSKSRRTGIAAQVILNSRPITPEGLKNLYINDPACYYCRLLLNRESIVFDHKQPLSREGKHEISNIAICCDDCNKLKGNRTEKEFRDFVFKYIKRFI